MLRGASWDFGKQETSGGALLVKRVNALQLQSSYCCLPTLAVQAQMPRCDFKHSCLKLKTAEWCVLYDSHALASELTGSLIYTLRVLWQHIQQHCNYGWDKRGFAWM